MLALLRRTAHACALLLAPFLATILAAPPLQAQTATAYPDRPIRLVVAFVAGGASDTMARLISNDLSEALGQPVVVENRSGAGGYIAWNHIASSPADGYTLLLAENALAISQALYKSTNKSSFDPLTQFEAIAGIAVAPSALIVTNSVPANSVAELVAWARKQPKPPSFASAGVGSVSHLNFEVFKNAVGMEAIHVPYKGGGQSISDVIAGHVPMTITSVQATKALVEDGKAKALAVTSPVRAAAMPKVPTMQEAGVKKADVELRFWFAMFAPKGMPEAVKAKLEKAVQTVTANAAVRERMAKLSITPDFVAAPAMQKKLAAEIRNWTAFIEARGIKVQ